MTIFKKVCEIIRHFFWHSAQDLTVDEDLPYWGGDWGNGSNKKIPALLQTGIDQDQKIKMYISYFFSRKGNVIWWWTNLRWSGLFFVLFISTNELVKEISKNASFPYDRFAESMLGDTLAVNQ